MTLDEEFDKEFVQEADFGKGLDCYLLVKSGNTRAVPAPKQIKAFTKSYLLNFTESIKLNEKYEERQTSCPERMAGCALCHFAKFADEKYNEALSDQKAKIAEELKKRGI